MSSIRALVTSCLLAACAVAGAAADAAAQGRPATMAMSCGQAQSMVRARGAVVMTTGQYTYDRFVSDQRFCSFDEETIPTWAPTRDAPQCMVGFRCEQRRSFPFNR
ncbi:MAG: hypothetical protein K2Y29_12105 [Beijerinckiaceae bacterium]|nr:hypothetical protein [Beijerinckiaceae bacterium]